MPFNQDRIDEKCCKLPGTAGAYRPGRRNSPPLYTIRRPGDTGGIAPASVTDKPDMAGRANPA